MGQRVGGPIGTQTCPGLLSHTGDTVRSSEAQVGEKAPAWI